MKKTKPPACTILTWLKNNLGTHCTAPLTSTDHAALLAAVQVVELYSLNTDKAVASAFAACVNSMQPNTRHLAYHAIAHVLDWGHRAQLWAHAGLPLIQNPAKCKFE